LAEKKETEAYTFSLSRFLPLIEQDLEKLPLSHRLREMVRKVTQKKDVKVLLTYPSSAQEAESLQLAGTRQSIHVWFEMAAHYERFALSDETWIHCFGFDNAFYYLLFIPALLRAMDPRSKLPDHVITNEFLLLDGSKFSTSRGHAIWADEVNEESEFLRLFLCLNRPDSMPSDFSRAKAQAFIFEMKGVLDHLNGRAQKVSGKMRQVDEGTLVLCNRFTRELELHYSPRTFNLRRGSRLLIDFIDVIRQAEGNESNEALMLLVFATAVAPILPNESKKLFAYLGIDGDQNRWISDWARVL
jgi:methionyl-tRNA synthetase